ncbi:hypothetical protein TNIN_414371 [Trichonephila inaurata madagascariensis]|uniref:Uncharacterized protein n=1 Tax=Trichonephila inaurata madagascariensis TaxID=2747483 RepID=A0A8X6X6K9_9ARAC|nr:hypothetical protein TNIN_414371 [Trichonephila inaurata madagascariensis]
MLDGLPPNSSVLPDGPPRGLISRGTTQVEKYRFSPPSARQMLNFPTLELALWCFSTIRLRGRGVEDVRRTFRHTSRNPFTEQRRV